MTIKSTSLLLVSLLILSSCKQLTLEEQAQRIHDKVLTLDTHNDTPMQFGRDNFDFAQDNEGNCIDIPKMEKGGLDGAFFAVFVGQGALDSISKEKANARALSVFERIHQTIEANPDKLLLATSSEDGYIAKKAGKRAMYIGVENGYALGGRLDMVDRFRELGARYITLVHSWNNDICDSATDTLALHNGLSPFGREVVKRMNEQGVMVDVSHASEKSAFDAIAASETPIIASHSCSYTICDSPRNMSDSLLKALKQNGGVMQMCILSSYVRHDKPNPRLDSAMTVLNANYGDLEALTEEQQKERYTAVRALRKQFPKELGTVAEAVDHIDYVVKLIGIDHVGIGTDFDGGGGLADCKTAADMKNITVELLRRGYSETDIEKIWSGNLLRVMRAVETYAQTHGNS